MTTDELVTVYQSPDPVTARIIAADLTNAGIAATVSGENQGGFPGVSVISVDVSVHASDAERARNIIEEMERSAATVDEVEEVQAEEE